MIIGVLLLVVIGVVGSTFVRRSGRASAPVAGPMGGERADRALPGFVEALLKRWTDAGLLTQEQSRRIRAYEETLIAGAEQPMKRSRVHAVAEALGYLGGALGTAGVVILIASSWDDFSNGVRVLLPVIAAAAFTIAGFVVPRTEHGSMLRLHSLLWTLAVAASGFCGWVIAAGPLDIESLRRRWLFVGVVGALTSAWLWLVRRGPLQQFTAVAGVFIIAATGIGEFASAGVCGLALWTIAALLLILSVKTMAIHGYVDVLAASLALVTGASLTLTTWTGPGLIFVDVTAVLLIMCAVWTKVSVAAPVAMITGVLGLIVLLQGSVSSLAYFAQEAGVATGLVLWGTGLILLVLEMLRQLRFGIVVQLLAGVTFIVGAAITGSQSVGFATVFGLATAVGLLVFGTQPGRVLMSMFGLIGLLVFIPWSIGHFFPGENRAPLLTVISGVLLVAIAVVMARMGGRFKGEVLGAHPENAKGPPR